MNEQDRRKLSKAISRATPEAPDVVLPVMVQRDGKPHLHRMALHTIWSGAGVRRCVNVLGHLTDEQHRVEHQAELLTAIDPEEDPARFLRRLQGIFDVVRLVDPEHRKVLALDSDGILTEKPGNCHMVWNKDTRCENCISAKAYARKTILNKIEFKDEEAYFVIFQVYRGRRQGLYAGTGHPADGWPLAGYGRPPAAAGPLQRHGAQRLS